MDATDTDASGRNPYLITGSRRHAYGKSDGSVSASCATRGSAAWAGAGAGNRSPDNKSGSGRAGGTIGIATVGTGTGTVGLGAAGFYCAFEHACRGRPVFGIFAQEIFKTVGIIHAYCGSLFGVSIYLDVLVQCGGWRKRRASFSGSCRPRANNKIKCDSPPGRLADGEINQATSKEEAEVHDEMSDAKSGDTEKSPDEEIAEVGPETERHKDIIDACKRELGENVGKPINGELAQINPDENESAIKNSNEALDENRKDVEALLNKGLAHVQMAEQCKKARCKKVNFPMVLFGRKQTEEQKKQREKQCYDEKNEELECKEAQYISAIGTFRKIPSDDSPVYSRALNGSAYASLKLERYEDAIEFYNEALKLNVNPKDTDALLNRAYANIKLGDHKKAIEDYEEILKRS